MPFSEQQIEEVRKVLLPKIIKPCPSCGQINKRNVVPELWLVAGFDLKKKHGQPPIADFFMPCVIILCSNCGYIEQYNVHVLGLAQVLDVPPANEPMFS